MKKYKFDKKKLIKDFFDLKKEINQSNIDEVLIGNYYLLSIKEILFRDFFPNKLPYFFTSDKKLKNNVTDTIRAYSTKFQNDIIKKSVDELNISEQIIFDDIIEKEISLKNQFFLINKNFSKENSLKEAHNDMFNSANHQLCISSINDNYFVPTNNEYYIKVKNNNVLSDYIALSHEIGHLDEYILTNNRISKSMVLNDKYKINNYEEVYSLFYELISVYNLYKDKYITEAQMSYYLNEIKDVNTLDIEYYILCLDYLNGIYNDNFKYVKLLKTNIQDISMYYYSYLIAVSLFEKYIKDEEKAFYSLNYLVNNITPNNESKVLKYCDIDLFNLREVKNHINKIKRNSKN